MIGYIVNHSGLGLGKVFGEEGSNYVIKFNSGKELLVNKTVIRRASLELNQLCETEKGKCVVKDVKIATGSKPHHYKVEYLKSGLKSKVSEISLSPLREKAALAQLTDEQTKSPKSRLENLGHGSYRMYDARDSLLNAYSRVISRAKGLKALLSCRIDLWPHQAFVAGTILLDRRRRYLLADEVGLGKTIEAGIVLHDLLAANANAKILILCPGALALQWLCEIYSKFGGHIFKLLDLHSHRSFDTAAQKHFIASTTVALDKFKAKILKEKWDMVIIDETHHLLHSAQIYDFAKKLSLQTPALLLLSATPARHREEEYLKLLALLEPHKYSMISADAKENFRALYSLQEQVGRKLRILGARIEGLKSGVYTEKDALEKIKNLAEIDMLKEDLRLQGMIKSLKGSSEDFAIEAKEIFHYVSDRYRISRRILKNRRQRLIADKQMAKINRKCKMLSYKPSQLEIDATEAAIELLKQAQKRKMPKNALACASKLFIQCLADPAYMLRLVRDVKGASRSKEEEHSEIFNFDNIISFGEWRVYWKKLASIFSCYASLDLLKSAEEKIEKWAKSESANKRLEALLKELKKKKASSKAKIIVFVGFPEMAEELKRKLSKHFDESAIVLFHAGLEMEEKEKSVQKFKESDEQWLLISDETGGEGRNFQFASEIFHYDNPLDAGKIEQRIGRLDRLGRDKFGYSDVVSNVIYNEWSEEAGIVKCFAQGLKVYYESISGLEFALREIDKSLALKAVEGGSPALESYIESLREIAERERVRDESEELYDEASFDRGKAEEFKSIYLSADLEASLQNAFLKYFWLIAPGKSTRVSENRGRITFHSADIQKVKLDPRFISANENKDWSGTFLRFFAQLRSDLSFFTIGNPFFDAIIGTLDSDPNGRTFAIERKIPGSKPWQGFRLVYRLKPNEKMLKGEHALAQKAEFILNPRPLAIFVKENGKAENNDSFKQKLSLPVDKKDKDRLWWNLTKEKAHNISRFFGAQKWQKVVNRACDVGEKEAKRLFAEQVEEGISYEEKKTSELITLIQRQKRKSKDVGKAGKQKSYGSFVKSGSDEEVASLKLFMEALRSWQVYLDSAGFISVNGGLEDVNGG